MNEGQTRLNKIDPEHKTPEHKTLEHKTPVPLCVPNGISILLLT